jgi:hypothetical protein
MKWALRMLLVFKKISMKNKGVFRVKVFGRVGQKFVTLNVKRKFQI